MFRMWMALILWAWSFGAQAAELRVLTAGAFKPVLLALQPVFESRTGHRLVIDNDTAGGLQKRIAAGEVFDAVISSPAALQTLQATHLSATQAPVTIARVGMGVAVRKGAAWPDLSSTQAFRTMLLGAERVAWIDPASGGSSGIYLARLFERWGLAEAMRAKSVLVQGGLVAQKVVDGSADLAIHQISEILAVPDAVLVGPLPPEVQNYTLYAAAASANTSQPQAVQDFLALFQSPEVRQVLQVKGMEPVQ